MKMSTTKSKYAKSAEQIKIELDETLKRLEQGVRDVFTSENYLEYLRFFAKMHNYSFNNTILIVTRRIIVPTSGSFTAD